jgi:hypothetical protein
VNDWPIKFFYMGKDVDDMSREELLEVVQYLSRELDSSRKLTQTVIDMQRTFEQARRNFSK